LGTSPTLARALQSQHQPQQEQPPGCSQQRLTGWGSSCLGSHISGAGPDAVYNDFLSRGAVSRASWTWFGAVDNDFPDEVLITSNGDGPILDERNDHFNFELRNIPGRQPRLLIISRSSAEAECYVVANGMET
jgi:hypothetical protein